jgi:hypothetical protein
MIFRQRGKIPSSSLKEAKKPPEKSLIYSTE